VAEFMLGKLGYVTYVPRILVKRPLRYGRTMEVIEPLFVNYLFVEIQMQWHAVQRCCGVSSILFDGAGPAHVPEQVIAELKGREGNDGLIRLAPARPAPEFSKGDPVRIVDGPFEGLDALCEGMKNGERVLVLLSLLGAERVIDLPRADIQRAVG
jgi:transcriptional antiterminator RfaH